MFLSKGGTRERYTLSAFLVKVGVCCLSNTGGNGALLRWTNGEDIKIETGARFVNSVEQAVVIMAFFFPMSLAIAEISKVAVQMT